MDDFILIKKVGEGSFGSVYKASLKSTGELVAIKKIKLSSANRSDIKNVANEVRVLCSLDHPNIVSYKCSFWDKYQSNICIVMEFLAGGDLNMKISALKKKRQFMAENIIWSYFIQLLKALKVLHDLKIIHRDIKAANVFLTQDGMQLKLGDMNVSKIVEKDFTKTRVGTPLYFSPEIWNGRSYNYKTDVWSLGCLLYEMCALNYPFNGFNMNDLKNCANRGRYAPIPSVYSKDMNEVIRLCLQIDDSKRPSVAKLLDHPIIKEKIMKVEGITETEPQFAEAKLIDTIMIPYDVRKMKLPSKKLLPKRSNSIGNIRESRPNLSRRDSNKENGNSDINFLANEVNKVIFKAPKPPVKNLPPSNPSKAYLNMAPKKPPVPQVLPNHAQGLKRRLSGDYESAKNYDTPRLAGNYMTPREIGSRQPSPQMIRIPSAGNNMVRKPLANLRPYF